MCRRLCGGTHRKRRLSQNGLELLPGHASRAPFLLYAVQVRQLASGSPFRTRWRWRVAKCKCGTVRWDLKEAWSKDTGLGSRTSERLVANSMSIEDSGGKSGCFGVLSICMRTVRGSALMSVQACEESANVLFEYWYFRRTVI